MQRGAYVLSDPDGAQATILASGSELGLAMTAQAQLATQGVAVRVVSMPSSSVFDRQPRSYRNDVLGALPRIGVEAGISRFWSQYGCSAALGVDRFGESGPGPAVFEHFGLTPAGLTGLVLRELDPEHPVQRSSP
jgi:transketolase